MLTCDDLACIEGLIRRVMDEPGAPFVGTPPTVVSVPTLQQVTDAGNTTTDLVVLSRNTNTNALQVENDGSGSAATFQQTGAGLNCVIVSRSGANGGGATRCLLVVNDASSAGTFPPTIQEWQRNGIVKAEVMFTGEIYALSGLLQSVLDTVSGGLVQSSGQANVLFCDCSAGNLTINLPKIGVDNAGAGCMIIHAVKTDATANTATLTPAAGATINGAPTKVLAAQYDTARLAARLQGNAWFLV